MGVISPAQVSDGTTIDASDLNNPINTIANEMNGGLDNNNIKAGAGISGAKLATDIPATSVLGLVKQRQGGAAGDATWRTPGATNVSMVAKSIKVQVGAVATSTGADITVTFPEAFTQIPLVVATVTGNNAGSAGPTQNAFAVITDKTLTTFAIRTVNDAGGASNQTCDWVAYGQ